MKKKISLSLLIFIISGMQSSSLSAMDTMINVVPKDVQRVDEEELLIEDNDFLQSTQENERTSCSKSCENACSRDDKTLVAIAFANLGVIVTFYVLMGLL